MKKRFVLFLAILSVLCCGAQEKKAKGQFTSQVNLGFVEGQAGSAFVLQTINGWKWQSFSMRLGLGLDYYGQRSVPLFVDLQKNILSAAKTPYLYVDGGIHFPWMGNNAGDAEMRTKPGLYYEAGIGYLMPVKSNAVHFSVGYSYKAYRLERESPVWCLTGDCANNVQKWSYQLRRISVKMGFRF